MRNGAVEIDGQKPDERDPLLVSRSRGERKAEGDWSDPVTKFAVDPFARTGGPSCAQWPGRAERPRVSLNFWSATHFALWTTTSSQRRHSERGSLRPIVRRTGSPFALDASLEVSPTDYCDKRTPDGRTERFVGSLTAHPERPSFMP